MMENRKNRKGFTMAELLIVVAIIGVLVAISIPIFKSQMKKARIATNQANARAAKAAALAEYQTDPDMEGEYVMYWYITTTGKLAQMMYSPDEDNSYIYHKGDDDRRYSDDGTFRFAIKFNGINGGNVADLTEKDKERLSKEIITKWGVKIALKETTIGDDTYEKGEVMKLVYEVTDNGGFGPGRLGNN